MKLLNDSEMKNVVGGTYVVKAWCSGCSKYSVNETHNILVRGTGSTQAAANTNFTSNKQAHFKKYSLHYHSLS